MAVRLCLPRHARPMSMLLVKRWCAKQDSNLHCTPSEGAASCHLGYWRVGAFGANRTRNLRRTGALLFQLSYEGEENGKRWCPHRRIGVLPSDRSGCFDRTERCGRNGVRAEPCRCETSTGRPDNMNGAGCVSRTRMFRFTRAALYLVQPSRQKGTNGQRRASAKGSDLATGTTAPSRVRRRWPILDVHDVKQRNAILPRAPKRCASASNSVMHTRRLSRRALRARRYIQPHGVPA